MGFFNLLAVCLTALGASALTFFSGFGLGTLLLPVFALFLPVEVAISAAALVHLANNLFKAVLVGRHASWKVIARFAVPAAFFAAAGASLLGHVAHLPPIGEYTWGGRTFSVTAVKLMVAALLAAFSFLELKPGLTGLSFDPKYLSLGGALSGFFGGLSGHQGALRSAFLVRAGLSPESFIGTGALCALLVDLARLAVYSGTFLTRDLALFSGQGRLGVVAAGTAAAFAGSLFGARFLKKVTLKILHGIVGGLLLLVSILLAAGWI